MVRYLLNHGADPDDVDANDRSPLVAACCNGRAHVVRLEVT
jgi:ankyrin repeat protein